MLMPQLDVSTFLSQSFWLVVTFAVLYFCVHFIIDPSIKKCFSARESFILAIEGKTAEFEVQMQLQKLKYENGIKDATTIAKDMMLDVELWMEKHRSEQDELLNKKVILMFEENEQKINLFKEKVEKEVENVAFDVSMMYNKKLLGDYFSGDSASVVRIKSLIRDVVKS